MNKFFERSILDELYEAKSDEFAQDIQNEMQEETKSFLVEEQLTNKIKEVIKDEGQQKEMLKKVMRKFRLKDYIFIYKFEPLGVEKEFLKLSDFI